MVGGKCWRIVLSVVVWRSQVRAGLAIWVCMPDQTHIRSSREANCTKIPLAAGRLERTKPFFVAALRGHAIHRFVHPDPPRLIGPPRLVFLRGRVDLIRRPSLRLPPSRRQPPHTSSRPPAACAPPPPWP